MSKMSESAKEENMLSALRARSRPIPERARWEYKVIDMAPGNDQQTEVRLNTWGSAGWEVVAVSVQFTSHFVWMKRQVPHS